MNTDEYPRLAKGRWPEQADDVKTFRQAACPEFPELPRRVWHVSASDLEDARKTGRIRIPLRLETGRRLSEIWYDMKDGKRRDQFAEKHGWPFMLHIANLEGAEEIKHPQ